MSVVDGESSEETLQLLDVAACTPDTDEGHPKPCKLVLQNLCHLSYALLPKIPSIDAKAGYGESRYVVHVATNHPIQSLAKQDNATVPLYRIAWPQP